MCRVLCVTDPYRIFFKFDRIIWDEFYADPIVQKEMYAVFCRCPSISTYIKTYISHKPVMLLIDEIAMVYSEAEVRDDEHDSCLDLVVRSISAYVLLFIHLIFCR